METDRKLLELRAQLQNSITYTSKQDQIYWTVFGIFSAANGLLISPVSESIQPYKGFRLLLLLLSAGMCLCYIWMRVQIRLGIYLRFYEKIVDNLESRLNIDNNIRLSREKNLMAWNIAIISSKKDAENLVCCINTEKRIAGMVQKLPIFILTLWVFAFIINIIFAFVVCGTEITQS